MFTHAKPRFTAADARTAERTFNDDVHCLTLDYLIHNATTTLLSEHARRFDEEDWEFASSPPPRSLQNDIRMVDSFVKLHKNLSQDPSLPRFTSYRLCLLRFLTLYTLHLEDNPIAFAKPSPSALATLRQKNRDRAGGWLSTIGNGAFEDQMVDFVKLSNKSANKDTAHEESAVFHTVPTTSNSDGENFVRLVDIIPSCIELTAARAQLGFFPQHPDREEASSIGSSPSWGTTPRGLGLLLSLMQVASLEPTCHRHPLEQVIEAFSWGPGPWREAEPRLSQPSNGIIVNRSADDDMSALDDEKLIHDIFHLGSDIKPDESSLRDSSSKLDPDYARTFRDLRRKYLAETLQFLSNGDNTEMSTRRLIREARLDRELIGYLIDLHGSIEAPLLVQLEECSEGKDDGKLIIEGIQLSGEESDRLKALFNMDNA